VPFCFVFAATLLLSICGTTFAQPGDTPVATVNGRTITLKEVDESILFQIYPLQQQLYAVRKVALDNLVTRIILEQTANRRNVSVDELKRQLTSGKVEVPAEQVEQFYADNIGVFGTMSPDEVKERLRLDFEGKARMKLYGAAVAELTKQSQIDLQLEEPRVYLSDSGNSPSVGPASAKITIVEFTDFQCAFCRTAQAPLKRILTEYRNQIRLVFKHLPLEMHPEAFTSAQAAYCAGEQRRFWEFHDALFAAGDLSAAALDQIATRTGLDKAQFTACLKSSASQAAIAADVRKAKQLGLNSTPVFIINGKVVRGAIAYEDFKNIVERELRSSRAR
jgi:protein-disulfide isomerase